jgi:hypothetical protein
MADEQFTIQDEWTDSAENEPDNEEEMWWARMLNEEAEESEC